MTAPTTAPPAAAPRTGSGPKLDGFVAAHKTQLIVVAGAAVVALYLKSRGTSSSSAGTAASTVPASGYSSDPYNAAQDAYNSLEPQLESLQSQLAAITPGASTTTPPPPPASAPTASNPFSLILNPAQAKQKQAQGFNIYTIGKGEYYTPSTKGSGLNLTRLLNPAQSKQRAAQGYKIYTVGGGQFFNPDQKVAK